MTAVASGAERGDHRHVGVGDEELVVGAGQHQHPGGVVGVERRDEGDEVTGERGVPQVDGRVVDRRPGDPGVLGDADVLQVVVGHQSSIGGSHCTPLMWLPPSAKIVLPVT